jgi:glutaconate CoA-transferase subunit A
MIDEPLHSSTMPRCKKSVDQKDLPALFAKLGHDGCSVCLGGLFKQSRPVALVRALMRSGLRNLRLFSSPGSGYDVDLLIAGGVVSETYLPAVTLENRLCPNFRAAVESGAIKAQAVDALTIVGGLLAAANGVPFQPVTAWAGSDILSLNPLIKRIESPFGSERVYAVRAISPDIVLLHAQEGDEYGNVRNLSKMTYADSLMARAGKKVVISVDKLIPRETIIRNSTKTTIANIYVEAIVEIPFGAHPTASYPFYSMDEEFIEAFADLSDEAHRIGNDAALREHMSRHVYGPFDSFEYLDTVGGYRRMSQLEREARFQ